MQVDVVSLRDIKMKVDDTIVIELQLSDAPDRELTDIIEADRATRLEATIVLLILTEILITVGQMIFVHSSR